MRILVFGAGYVGLSNAILLSRYYSVRLVDIDKEKINTLKSKKSPIGDSLIKKYLKDKHLNLDFSCKLDDDLVNIDVVLIATPTSFDDQSKRFDTTSIEKLLKKIKKKKFSKLVVIRSTVPIGFTDKMQRKYPDFNISFFPEFLREGFALRDNLFPSRIICGSKSKKSNHFLNMLKKAAKKKKINTLVTSPSEAEAIKLFSNTFLAMRISFFNELDTFAASKNLSAKDIIEGVCMDSRIGNFYNNPSFGYGGYCLPKDTKQLKENFKEIPQKIIHGTILSNKLRKDFIVNEIDKKNINRIGVYRLSMKTDSDNWRESAVIDIIKKLKKKNKVITIYEPLMTKKLFLGCKVENNLKLFKQNSEMIIANRLSKNIDDKIDTIYSRDIFREN